MTSYSDIAYMQNLPSESKIIYDDIILFMYQTKYSLAISHLVKTIDVIYSIKFNIVSHKISTSLNFKITIAIVYKQISIHICIILLHMVL